MEVEVGNSLGVCLDPSVDVCEGRTLNFVNRIGGRYGAWHQIKAGSSQYESTDWKTTRDSTQLETRHLSSARGVVLSTISVPNAFSSISMRMTTEYRPFALSSFRLAGSTLGSWNAVISLLTSWNRGYISAQSRVPPILYGKV